MVKEILDIDTPELVEKVLIFLRKEKKVFWDNLTPSQKEEINLGIKQLDEGKKISFESFLNKIS